MKKTLALLMALVMMSLTFALAALPSKTSSDIASVGQLIADGDENKECIAKVPFHPERLVDVEDH